MGTNHPVLPRARLVASKATSWEGHAAFATRQHLREPRHPWPAAQVGPGPKAASPCPSQPSVALLPAPLSHLGEEQDKEYRIWATPAEEAKSQAWQASWEAEALPWRSVPVPLFLPIKKPKDAPALPGKGPSSKRERKEGKVTLSEAAQQRAGLLERLCHQPAPVTSSNATSPWELASLLLLPCVFPSSKCQPRPVSLCSWEQGRGSNALQKPAAKITDPVLSPCPWGASPVSLGRDIGIHCGYTIRKGGKGIRV